MCFSAEEVSWSAREMMPTTTPSGHISQGGASGRVPYFRLAGTRGKSAPALVDYILVAEFDIDSGR